MSSFIHLEKIFIQQIVQTEEIMVDVLRLDTLHPVVSGNKWFKLKYYLEDAVSKGCSHIATFGGAYSNHLLATAFVCKEMNLQCTGIVRGEEAKQLSHTLQDAKNYGMNLLFVSRSDYKNKQKIKQQLSNEKLYFINEGGYGSLGVKGAAEIMNWINESYTHILAAIGTGTMFAGLIKAAKPHQTIIGINVMKGNTQLLNEINFLLTEEDRNKNYVVRNEFHFGGYAKRPAELIRFMNYLWQQYQLPTDFVYNSKTMFAVFNLIAHHYFPAHSKIMALQCGGLQGNYSLPKNILIF
jgi:1-aminocyclopropane-1-carboxylate deaminase